MSLPDDVLLIIDKFVKNELFIVHMANKVKNNKAFIKISQFIDESIKDFLWFIVNEDIPFTYSSIFIYFDKPTLREEMLFSHRFHTIFIYSNTQREIFWYLVNNNKRLINHAYDKIFYFLLHCIINDLVLSYDNIDKICYNNLLNIIDEFLEYVGRYESFISYSTADITMLVPYIMELIINDMNIKHTKDYPSDKIEIIIKQWFKEYSNIHLLIPHNSITSDNRYEILLRQFIYACLASNVIEYWYGWYYLSCL